jgi:hypothetical protein
MNWDAMFGLSVSPGELVIRGTLMYLTIFILLRILPNREAGGLNLSNIWWLC